MTDTFVKTEEDKASTEEQGNFSGSTDNLDKKSVEGQLEILQKRFDDQLPFIDTLKEENKQYRDQIAQLEQMDNLKDKIDKLLAGKETSQKDEYTGTQNQTISASDLKSQGFITKEDLENQKLEALQAENFIKVKSALVDSYGEDKFMDSLEAKAVAIGMTMVDVDRLSHSNPDAAIKLFGQEKTSNTSISSGTINTQAFDKTNSQQLATPKTVMYGATTKDAVANWMAAGEIAQQQTENL